MNLQAITPFAIELHDIIVTKLGRYHAKDRSDIELLTRVPGFREEHLAALYALARDDMKLYANRFWEEPLYRSFFRYPAPNAHGLGTYRQS